MVGGGGGGVAVVVVVVVAAVVVVVEVVVVVVLMVVLPSMLLLPVMGLAVALLPLSGVPPREEYAMAAVQKRRECYCIDSEFE